MVGGELVTALAEATDTRIIPVDSEHSALFQLVRASGPGSVERLVLTASGGPFRGRTDLRDVTPEEALAHPTWEMGGQDHDRLGDADEQGLRADRGAPPVRLPLRADRRRRPPPVDRARARPPERRRHAGPSRLPGHARSDLLRAPLPGARRRRPAEPRPGRGRRARPSSRPTSTPFRACGWRARPARRGVRRPASSTPRTRWRSRRSSTAGSRSRRSPRSSRGTLDALPAARPGHFEDLYAVDAEARERARS